MDMEKISMGENEIRFEVDEEAALVRAAREDPEAFALLYHRYVTPVYRYLYQRADSASDAEDLTT
jgi:DNA-directed RNA polymerase specialized sigma24 family protein